MSGGKLLVCMQVEFDGFSTGDDLKGEAIALRELVEEDGVFGEGAKVARLIYSHSDWSDGFTIDVKQK